jgi:cell division protein FtsB
LAKEMSRAFLPPLPRKYKGAFAIGVVVLLLLVVAAIWGDHGLIHLLRMRGEQQGLEHLAFDQQQRNEQLRQHIRRLQSDDWYLEKLARERLGLVKNDEVIYRVTAPPAPPAAANGPASVARASHD